MSETPFLKCPCHHCGSSIEFPAHGIGYAIDCPHCGVRTKLFRPEPVEEDGVPAIGRAEAEAPSPSVPVPPAQPPSRVPKPRPLPVVTAESVEATPSRPGKRVVLIIAASVVAGALAGGGFYVWKNRASTSTASSADPGAIPTNGIASSDPNAATFNTPINATKPKNLDDLKAGNPTLEKAKTGSLVYAVGVLKNDSDHQRYGVRVDFELLDASGKSVGKASDYKDVIEPRKEWRYRALVLTKKAASARLVSVNEDP